MAFGRMALLATCGTAFLCAQWLLAAEGPHEVLAPAGDTVAVGFTVNLTETPSPTADFSIVEQRDANSDEHPLWRRTFGAEVTYLDVVFASDDFSLGMSPGGRFWLGAENQDNLGGRITFWGTGATEADFNRAILEHRAIDLNLYTLDIDFTQRGDFDNWNWLLYVGGRYAAYHMARQFVDSVNHWPWDETFASNLDVQTGGITTGSEISHPIRGGPLEFFMGIRLSASWGEADLKEYDFPGGFYTKSQGVGLYSPDLQVGLQWSKNVAGGNRTWFGRCVFEYQAWDFVSVGSDLLPANLALFGVAASTGITW